MFNKKLKMSIIWIAAAIMTISACLLSVLLIAPFGENKGSDITGGALGDPVAPVLSNETCGMHIKKPNSVNSEDYEICTNKVHLINTEEELLYLMGAQANTFAGACFKMNMKDVSLTGWAAIGLFNNGTAAGGTFTGHFNGNGASIMYMLTESDNSAKLGKGLFPNVTGGTIENLTANVIVMQAPQASYTQGYLGTQFANAYVTGVNLNVMSFQQVSTNVGYSAGLVYNATSATLIENSNVNFLATTPMAMTYFGGLVYNLESSRLNSCKVTYTGTADMTLSYYGGAAYQTRTTANHTISPSIENCSVTLPEIVGTGNVIWSQFGGLVYDGNGSPGVKYLNNTVKMSDIKGSSYYKNYNNFGGIVKECNSEDALFDNNKIYLGDGYHNCSTGGGVVYNLTGANTKVLNTVVKMGSGRFTFDNFNGIAFQFSGAGSLIDTANITYPTPSGARDNNTIYNLGGVVYYNGGANNQIVNCSVKFGDGAQKITNMGGIAYYNNGSEATIERSNVNFGNGDRSMYNFGGVAYQNSASAGAAGNSGRIISCNVKFGDGAQADMYNFGGVAMYNGGAQTPLIDKCSVDFGSGNFTRTIRDGGGVARYSIGNNGAVISNTTVVMPKEGLVNMYNFGGIAQQINSGIATYHQVSNCSVKFPRTADNRITSHYFGGIAYHTNGNTEITDCDVDINMNTTRTLARYNHVAGMVGNAAGSLNMTDCLVAGDGIYGKAYTAGLVGYINLTGKEATFTRCNVTVTDIVTSTDAVNYYTTGGSGGLFGEVHSANANSNVAKLNVTDCGNWANVTSISGQSVGGIIGLAWYGGAFTFANVVNAGNIKLEDNNSYVGGFIGHNNTVYSMEFINCSNYGDVTGGQCVGGFIGFHTYRDRNTNSYWVSKTTYTDCKNYGTIKSSVGYIGGLTGYEHTNSEVSATNCENYGLIDSSLAAAAASRTGGFFGNFENSHSGGPINLNNLKNYGEIKGNGNGIGGIVGYIQMAVNPSVMSYLENFGDVTSNSNYYTGGLFGWLSGADINRTITDAVWRNWGSVTAQTHCIGGLVGYYNGNGNDFNLKTAENYGKITLTGSTKKTDAYAGGLFGHFVNSRINRLRTEDADIMFRNYGDIINKSGGISGGLFGYLATGENFIPNMYNYGSVVESYAAYSGGLIGSVSSASINKNAKVATVAENYANLTYTGNFAYTGGLFGIYVSETVVFDTAKNMGEVSSNGAYTAGLFGALNSSTFLSKDAVNYKTVTGNGEYLGGMIGYSSSSNINNTITDRAVWRNFGNIVGGTNYAGGMIGRLEAGTHKWTKMHNGGSVIASGTAVGGIIGRAYNATITNIAIAEGDIVEDPSGNEVTDRNVNFVNYGEVKGANTTGGIIGYYYGTDSTIISAVNYANVTGTQYRIGGLFGYIQSVNFKKVEGTTFKGENWGNVITDTATTSGYEVGGLAGKVESTQYFHVSEFNNYGKDVKGQRNVGGFIGYCYNVALRMEGSDYRNYANIYSTKTGSNDDAGTGGIVGRFESVAPNTDPNHATHYTSTLHNVKNYGDIAAFKGGDVDSLVGGMIGYVMTASSTLQNCINYGDIVADGYHAGGLYGHMNGNTHNFKNCENQGNVTTDTIYAGGFIGYTGSITFNMNGKNVNYGNVWAKNAHAGGLVGYMSSTTFRLNVDNTDSFTNVGTISTAVEDENSNVSGGSFAGGFAGYATATNIIARNVKNYGEVVSKKSHAGGLLGYMNGSATFYNVENYGNVTAYDEYAGGFFGQIASSTPINIQLFNNLGAKNVNYGNVFSYGKYVGGIIGYMQNNTLNLWDLQNCGQLVSNYSEEKNGGDYVGGIAGYLPGVTAYLKRVENYANVNAKGNYAGGLIGRSHITYLEAAKNFGSNVDVDGNVATPSVTATGHNVGGLIGYTDGSTYLEYGENGNGAVASMNETLNATNVSGKDTVGGLLGYTGSVSYLGRVNNYGDVIGDNYVGGFFGQQAAWMMVNDLIIGGENIYRKNNGSLVKGVRYVGGIAGYYYATNTNWVEKLMNFADVTGVGESSSEIGGIFGRSLYPNGRNFKNFRNMGDVTGGSDVGGIVGLSHVNSASQTSYYDSMINYGKVVGKKNVGGLVGQASCYHSSYRASEYFRNCVNYGDITGGTTQSEASNVGQGNTGGFIGLQFYAHTYIQTGSSGISPTDRCAQYGKINDGTTDGFYVGSIVGQVMYGTFHMYHIYYVAHQGFNSGHAYYGKLGAGGSYSLQVSGFETEVTEKPTIDVPVVGTFNYGTMRAKVEAPRATAPTANTEVPKTLKPVTPPTADVAQEKPTTPDIPLAPDKPAKNIIVETQLTDMKVTTTFLFAELSGFHIESLHISVAGMEETKYTQLIHNGVVVNYLGNTSNPLGTEVKMWDATQPRPFEKTFIVSYDAKTTIETVSYKLVGKNTQTGKIRTWTIMGNGGVTEIK